MVSAADVACLRLAGVAEASGNMLRCQVVVVLRVCMVVVVVGGGDETVVMSKEGNNEQAWDGDRQ